MRPRSTGVVRPSFSQGAWAKPYVRCLLCTPVQTCALAALHHFQWATELNCLTPGGAPGSQLLWSSEFNGDYFATANVSSYNSPRIISGAEKLTSFFSTIKYPINVFKK